MVNNSNNKIIIENKKPVETVQEIENYQIKKSPLSPAARGKVVNKSGSNFSSEKEGYGPMPLYRDVAPFVANFSESRSSSLEYRGGLFQYRDGTIQKRLPLRGIDKMKEALRKLENGDLKVVRREEGSNLNETRYKRMSIREAELKTALREKIRSLENDYSWHDENKLLWIDTFIGRTIQN